MSNHPSPQILWSPQRSEKLLQGTVATGAGLSLLAILMDQIRSERRKTRASESGKVLESSNAPLVITPDVPPQGKQATLTEWAMGGAAGLGAYMLIQKAYQEVRRKQLKSELAAEDEAYTQALRSSSPKQAADLNEKFAFNLLEAIANLPKDTIYIPGLLSAAGTYALLDRTWPGVSEKPEGVAPRKIVVKGYGTVVADGPGDGPIAQMDKAKGKQLVDDAVEAGEGTQSDEDPSKLSRRPWIGNMFSKAASLEAPVSDDDVKSAAASMIYLLAEQPQIKAAASGLIRIIGAHYANPQQTVELVKNAGVLDSLDILKRAEETYHALDVFEKRAAIHHAISEPLLTAPLTVLAVSELAAWNPDLSKRAKTIANHPEVGLMAVKAAAIAWQAEAVLAPDSYMKTAAAAGYKEDMRRQMGTLGISESKDSGGDVDEADDAYASKGVGKEDPIDLFMAGRQ